MVRTSLIIFLLLFIIDITGVVAQKATPPAPDTLRIIHIVHGKTWREKTIDSTTTIQTIAGNVLLEEGTTKFYCDSAAINAKTNVAEAFGHVHIIDADSVHTYADYLRYVGADRMAFLKKNVKLTDGKSTLFTPELQYDMKAGIGTYSSGGKVINGKTILTSKNGTYYSDTKDVFFRNNVDLIDPKQHIIADSLNYNTETQNSVFLGPTHIINKDLDIFTTSGNYNLKTGEANFDQRTRFKDSSGRTFVANHTAYDEKSGVVQMEGRAVIRDSANGYIVVGDQIFIKKVTNEFLASRKPVLIIWQGKDSTYISGDTLFSGLGRRSMPIKDSIGLGKYDTVKRINNVRITDTTARYFIAFHQVRIFNDSLQSVSDSLYYSAEDSVFRLFKNPIVWSKENQVNGDTMYLFTKNRKAERLYVFENGMIINKINSRFYNQMSGKTLNGYFLNGVIDYMRVKGSKAESIYYIQDQDSAWLGMNRAKGDVIDLFFKDQALNKVLFVHDVSGTLHPVKQIPAEEQYLKNFKWQDARRPKTKLELFE